MGFDLLHINRIVSDILLLVFKRQYLQVITFYNPRRITVVCLNFLR